MRVAARFPERPAADHVVSPAIPFTSGGRTTRHAPGLRATALRPPQRARSRCRARATRASCVAVDTSPIAAPTPFERSMMRSSFRFWSTSCALSSCAASAVRFSISSATDARWRCRSCSFRSWSGRRRRLALHGAKARRRARRAAPADVAVEPVQRLREIGHLLHERIDRRHDVVRQQRAIGRRELRERLAHRAPVGGGAADRRTVRGRRARRPARAARPRRRGSPQRGRRSAAAAAAVTRARHWLDSASRSAFLLAERARSVRRADERRDRGEHEARDERHDHRVHVERVADDERDRGADGRRRRRA